MKMSSKQIIGVIIALVVVGGLSFYGGTKYAAGTTTAARSGQFAGRFGGAGGTGSSTRSTAGLAMGQIISIDPTGITIQLANGGSRIILTSDSTPILESVEASSSDLQVGQSVVVQGTVNSDGSETAQSIQVRQGQPQPAPAVQDQSAS